MGANRVNRRTFLRACASGLGILAAGGVIARYAGFLKHVFPRGGASKAPLGSRVTSDISAYEHTDPSLLLYEESAPIPTDFQNPKCIAIGRDESILVGGDQSVKLIGSDGRLRSTIALPDSPNAVAPADEGRIVVAMTDHVETYDVAGTLQVRGEPLGGKSYLTGIAHSGDTIYAADAGNREIVRCDARGKAVARFGRIGSKDGNPGFVVPSPYLNVLIGDEGLLWVNNFGRHRVEAYTMDGRYETGWGNPSMAVEGFCGCCNPVYFCRLPDGRFVTSEKGLNRIKIYDPQGEFEGVVAGPEILVKNRALARKACANCRIGFGIAVACDSAGRVLALDPVTRNVRVFVKKA